MGRHDLRAHTDPRTENLVRVCRQLDAEDPPLDTVRGIPGGSESCWRGWVTTRPPMFRCAGCCAARPICAM